MLPMLLLNDADTLVFIDPAPEDHSRNYLLPPTIPHRLHSEKLLATGSTYFQRLFSTRCQTLIRKRRGFANSLPAGVKYVIDLTPPTVDEDAIIVLTEVSCPMPIRTWALLQEEWNLPPSCVGGEDELEVLSDVPQRPAGHRNTKSPLEEEKATHPSILDSEAEDEGLLLSEGMNRSVWPQQPAQTALPIEYSPQRHREAIEQILHVLEGLDTTLDTPCKLWTFFAVAKILDVAKVPAVSGYIMAWFYHSTNIHFLEIHPEISYRVSCGIKVAPLCVDSFIGLVGDEALLYIMREARLTPPRAWAPILDRSRVADFLDDTDVQRIEYASKSFADKIIGDFLRLVGTDMPWIADVGEFDKLNQHRRDFPEDEALVRQLITLLKDFIRARIYRVLCNAKDPRRSCSIPGPTEDDNIRCKFDPPAVVQRIIGRNFWRDLLSLDLHSSHVLPVDQYHNSIAEIGHGMAAFEGQENACVDHVPKYSVEQKVREFNMRVKHQESVVMFHPSKRRALGANRGHLSNSSVNMSRPLQASEPLAPMDDGHSKPFTINLRYPELSQLVQGSANSSSSDNPLGLPFRLSLHSPSDENQIPVRCSDGMNTSLPLNSTTTPVLDSIQQSTSVPFNAEERTFDLDHFLSGAFTRVTVLSRALLFPHGANTTALEATDTLFSLKDNQFRFLPLNGNGGFSAPGPAVHTGSVASTNTDRSFSEIDPDDSLSTVQGASHQATHSHASDLLSVDSVEGLSQASHDGLTQTYGPGTSMSASAFLFEDEYDFDVRSDDGDTVVMGSPRLSDIDDDEEFDLEMEHPDNDNTDDSQDSHDNHDDGFELVDSL
ncbi:uncharacterized protein N7458_004465 [Penicillium daleae]|uniref:Uncharacterized protein n=1 Tax=Penicillium daleae TaxID=63821 RepID=A0AAD6C6L3_9EURO|nr:uncharacterized protein N7458_004465 [Penicillium daleae]KAJ5453509.1 hypothetical protein N7458_004465 [Penicillium daleae]